MTGADYQLNIKAFLDTTGIKEQIRAIELSKNGKITLKFDTSGAKRVNEQLSNTAKSLKNVQTTAAKTSQSVGDIFNKMSRFAVVGQVIGMMTQAISGSYEAIKNLDVSLTEFKKVSDLTGKSLDNYVAKLSEMGKVSGRTTSEMVDAATEFKKSGYSDADSAVLAKTASIFQNVADSELSASDAALVLISNMKAFNFTAEESSRVIDAINEVSNNFSVSSTDLSLGMSKTASAMSTLGNSFEQTIALMTGAGEILPNQSGKIARGLRTIGLNISAIANKGEDLALGYNNITVALKDSNGQMRSTYDILEEIAKYWDEMSEAQRQSLGLTIAGKLILAHTDLIAGTSLELLQPNYYSDVMVA